MSAALLTATFLKLAKEQLAFTPSGDIMRAPDGSRMHVTVPDDPAPPGADAEPAPEAPKEDYWERTGGLAGLALPVGRAIFDRSTWVDPLITAGSWIGMNNMGDAVKRVFTGKPMPEVWKYYDPSGAEAPVGIMNFWERARANKWNGKDPIVAGQPYWSASGPAPVEKTRSVWEPGQGEPYKLPPKRTLKPRLGAAPAAPARVADTEAAKLTKGSSAPSWIQSLANRGLEGGPPLKLQGLLGDFWNPERTRRLQPWEMGNAGPEPAPVSNAQNWRSMPRRFLPDLSRGMTATMLAGPTVAAEFMSKNIFPLALVAADKQRGYPPILPQGYRGGRFEYFRGDVDAEGQGFRRWWAKRFGEPMSEPGRPGDWWHTTMERKTNDEHPISAAIYPWFQRAGELGAQLYHQGRRYLNL